MLSAAFIFFLFLENGIFTKGDCIIRATNNRNFKIYMNGFHWVTPIDNFNGTKEIIAEGEFVNFNCDNGFVDDSLIGKNYEFQCIQSKLNKTFLYEDLLCKSDFHKKTRTVQVSPIQLGSSIFKCDGKGLEVYQVKAEKADGSLKHLYTVCFDRKVMRTKYVFQPKRVEKSQRERSSRRDVWGFDRFGKTAWERLKLTDGYVSRIQKLRITRAFPDKYNKKNKYPYTFNRGHLAPYSDFIELDHKKASCQYINVAPQWKEFNGNSWSLVEQDTRALVEDNPIEWEIYTGTYGSIPTTRGPLFVSPFFDQHGRFVKGFVPVPKLYWKLVYNTVHSNMSRAFIGVNNPELKSPEEFTDKYLICKPKPGEGGTLYRGNEFKGFTYECDVNEFLTKLGKDENVVKIFAVKFVEGALTENNYTHEKIWRKNQRTFSHPRWLNVLADFFPKFSQVLILTMPEEPENPKYK